MARWDGDCDWTHEPWFLQGEDDVFDAMGFPLAARREAAANLARLFTPAACRAIREDPESGYGSVILLFYCYWPGLVIPLLEVGRDLGVVAPWNDAGLLTRLTKRNEFYEAAFELRVLANLRRRGYRCERVSESSARKTPDVRVQIDSMFVRAARPGEAGVALRTTRRPRTAVSLGSASLPVGGGTMTFQFDGRPPEVSPPKDEILEGIRSSRETRRHPWPCGCEQLGEGRGIFPK